MLLREGIVLGRLDVVGFPLLTVRGEGGVISRHTDVSRLWCVRLTGSVLAGGQRGFAPLAEAGLVGAAGGVGGTELDGRGVLQGVLARLHLKRHRPHTHQAPGLAALGLVGRVGRGSSADHAAGGEEGQSDQ